MKIQYLSDVHQTPIDFKITGDVLVTAGDMGNFDCDAVWVSVNGNHEFYTGSVADNGIKLSCRSVRISGVKFLGCTLWSDARELHALNDVNYVNFDLICKWHQLQTAWLWDQVRNGHTKDAVIITHHAPSFKSERSGIGRKLTPAFCNNMDQLVRESEAKLWIHGHTHNVCDYYINRTRVVSNPVGYVWENTGYEEGKYIEI